MALIGAALAGCGGEAPNPPAGGAFGPAPPAPGAAEVTQSALCTPARASEDLSARADLTDLGMMTGQTRTVKISIEELYARFDTNCGSCHGKSLASGNRQLIDAQAMLKLLDASWLVPVKSNDPAKYMPPAPTGKPYSTRDAADPIAVFVTYVEAWLAQGRPAAGFNVEVASSGTGSYAFTPDMAKSMTNLGNCVPNAAAVGNVGEAMMKSADAFFEGAMALPSDLSQTDLTTFDSATLAAAGVVAFVPAYPLWSAGSGKLRHIRVPRGKTVTFDKATQTFHIPDNTRFYKTFFRKVVDRTGASRNRKIETRLIVAKADDVGADGVAKPRALFGTYKWSEDESTATLVTLPYRDGTPFADQHFPYTADEKRYQEILDSLPPGGDLEQRLEAALATAPGVVQHYAIPGRVRCEQCHMGSVTKDFVLGFLPLQIARRRTGEGGTYEPTGEDELNQLQRLIDYGVISGIAKLSDILPLEQSQGDRKHRTKEELAAQGYLLGNCAHCHNPRGFPSVSKPALADALNFMPDGRVGGIFGFPLEKVSPIRKRGANGDVPVPYITPSLYDYPVTIDGLLRKDNGLFFVAGSGGDSTQNQTTWTPKFLRAGACADDDATSRGYCGTNKDPQSLGEILAPWRSLIYRNVDAPFPYIDDFVPFPHMPMNSVAFDPRAPRIVGEWMVSLPAVRVSNLPEFATKDSIDTSKPLDDSPQPYKEIQESDDPEAFKQAQTDAAARLARYKSGLRWAYDETELGTDIFDPIGIPSDERSNTSAFLPYQRLYDGSHGPIADPRDATKNLPQIGVPYHSHWFDYDPTELPPPWSPRRTQWASILPPGKAIDTEVPPGQSLTPDLETDRRLTLSAINATRLSQELVTYATADRPFALWDVKPGCSDTLKAAGVKAAKDYTGTARPSWMDTNPKVTADSLVYTTSPGETLYRHICFNCHGPNADGRGLQADALAAASEGNTRPANFRNGLFGPSDNPGLNMTQTFVVPGSADAPVTWAARYMAWMGLGGTNALIPENILRQVQATTVFGEQRKNLDKLAGGGKASANMLQLARSLCGVFAPYPFEGGTGTPLFFSGDYAFRTDGSVPQKQFPPYADKEFPLITSNGDAEMWRHLCMDYSPWLIRVYVTNGDSAELRSIYRVADPWAVVPSNDVPYPVEKGLLDHNFQVVNTADPTKNHYAACLRGGYSPNWGPDAAIRKMPLCDEAFLKKIDDDSHSTQKIFGKKDAPNKGVDDLKNWAARGAAVTGMSVFSYLKGGGAQKTVRPYYNECNLVRTAP